MIELPWQQLESRTFMRVCVKSSGATRSDVRHAGK